MIWTNEDKLIIYVGDRVRQDVFYNLVKVTILPLVDVVGLTCGTIDSSRLYFIQGKDMKIRELKKAKYHKNSKHITIEAPFKIYTTDKKELFDYYKKQFHKGIQYIEECINSQEQKANTTLKTNIQKYALKNIQRYREQKVNSMNVYRQTIESIKKL